jgi:hypothetical protein
VTCGGLEALGGIAVGGFAPVVLSCSGLPPFGSLASVFDGFIPVLSCSGLPVLFGSFASVLGCFISVLSGAGLLELFGSFASVFGGFIPVLSCSGLPVLFGSFASVLGGLFSVFIGLSGVSPLSGGGSLLPVTSFFSNVLGAVEPELIAGPPGGFVVGDMPGSTLRAATTPLPVNSPGLLVAAMGGWPRFSDARRARLLPAVRSCSSCAGIAATCCS